MTHQLILDVPEEVYRPLIEAAQRKGSTPEQLAVEWLTAGRQAAEDPLERFIGAIPSAVPDWADAHDKYLGQALNDELSGKKAAES
jgi:hypothetical protein